MASCCTSDSETAIPQAEEVVACVPSETDKALITSSGDTEAGETSQSYRQLSAKLELLESQNKLLESQNKLLQDRVSSIESNMASSTDVRLQHDMCVTLEFARASASRQDCLQAGKAYLLRHQLAYAIAAFAIGALNTIFPLYATKQLELDLSVVGYIMTGGELAGILTTYYAEMQTTGFLFSRPFDLYFILASLGGGLASVALWPTDIYVGACASAIYVSLINSPSRTVIGECISRLASALDIEQAVALAKANSFRRLGNTVIGVTSILTYSASPKAFFLIAGALIVLLIPELIRIQDLITEAHVNYDRVKNVRDLTAHTLHGEPDEIPKPSGRHSITFIADVANEESIAKKPMQRMKTVEKQKWSTMFVLIHVFSIMDAWISRFPFVWFAVAIKEQTDDSILAAACFASFHFCRAIGQSLQLQGFTKDLHHFGLNFAAVIGYAVMLTVLLDDPKFEHWYVMVIPTGLAETLPTQQRCLMDALNIPPNASMQEKAPIRELVKMTHFGTSVGSALAFVSTALVYKVLKGDDILVGIAGLGVIVGMLKVLTGLYIAMTVGQRGQPFCSCKLQVPVIDTFVAKGSMIADLLSSDLKTPAMLKNSFLQIAARAQANIQQLDRPDLKEIVGRKA